MNNANINENNLKLMEEEFKSAWEKKPFKPNKKTKIKKLKLIMN